MFSFLTSIDKRVLYEPHPSLLAVALHSRAYEICQDSVKRTTHSCFSFFYQMSDSTYKNRLHVLGASNHNLLILFNFFIVSNCTEI